MAQWTRGLAAAALAVGIAAGGIALARGPDMNLQTFGSNPTAFRPSAFGAPNRFFSAPAEEPRVSRSYDDTDHASKPKRAKSGGSTAAFGYGKAVCVRLCDGFFFPTGSTSGGEAACAAQCPDSPTALYTMPTDRIEDAVSSAGLRYSALPVAKRYQTSFESTCTCRRDTVASRAKEILRDTTLRKGDVVMTAAGFRVYQGDSYGPNESKDFVALSKSRDVSKSQRAELAQMERASAGSPAPAAPALVAARPKGSVTVDNGEAAPVR